MCQPALSRTRTISLPSPAPTAAANAASTALSSSASTVLQTNQTTSPVAGWTKPYRWSHSWRGGGARARPPPAGGPLPPQDRLQPEPVLVEGPDLDRPTRVPLATLAHLRGQLFLYAACSSGLAALACRGRGRWAL